MSAASVSDPSAIGGQASVSAPPALYEINLRVLLFELGRELGRPATLDDIPDAYLDRVASLGCDWIWLLGIWQTGAHGDRLARTHAGVGRELKETLADLTAADIASSPFAVQQLRVHTAYGDAAGLARLRARLQARGLKLMLDFVPNHTAVDHPWASAHPEYFVQGSREDLARQPDAYVEVQTAVGPKILAHGRDPYFPAWTDTLQLNYRHAGLRAAQTAELLRLATLCDGLRCDMAMLLLPEVIDKTWSQASLPADGTAPVDRPFWEEVIPKLKAKAPGFTLMAEVYWDLEWQIQQQGFDFAYDKRLYDRLHTHDAHGVRQHLKASMAFQRRLARFLENHDEPRAAARFTPAEQRAAAVITFLSAGLKLLHEGQLEGRKARVPMQLVRRPQEAADKTLADFYRDLFRCVRRDEVSRGHFQLLDCVPAWDGNPTADHFVSFTWRTKSGRQLLCTVNYGDTAAQCYAQLPFSELRGRRHVLRDLMSPATYERDGDELVARGLYLDLPAWGFHVFEMRPVGENAVP
ncbi:MAG: alpha-amylase [Deltaproteobacteria bacterium]|nr:alpha-amylase [Deltaproteobacteria bacterium]